MRYSREVFDSRTWCVYVISAGYIAYRLPIVSSNKYVYVFDDSKEVLNYEDFRRDYKRLRVEGIFEYSKGIFSIKRGEYYVAYANVMEEINIELLRLVKRGDILNDLIVATVHKLFSDDVLDVLLSDFIQSFRYHNECYPFDRVEVPFDPSRYFAD